MMDIASRYADRIAASYGRIEDALSASRQPPYPEEVQKDHYKQWHQTEEIAWKYLGTEARMAELGKLVDEAARLATTEMEKQRVSAFRGLTCVTASR